jgi:hypothetical protein
VTATQRLASNAQWDVPLELPDGRGLHLLVWHATPPVFDGPEDRNGRRNHDETAFWLRLLDGDLSEPAPEAPFVILGQANMDPVKGDGLPDAIRALLSHLALQDPAPIGASGTDTADFTAKGGPGRLRTDVILPSADLTIIASGVDWPSLGDPRLPVLEAASRHRPIWVEIALP